MIAVRALLTATLAVAGFPEFGIQNSEFRIQTSASSPTPQPQIRILSPAEDAFLIGLTRLRAAVEPPNVASSVVFSVDGQEVCTVTKPPFECEWDAGPTIAPHQVRLAVNLVGGGRLLQIARTKGTEFAEQVDVDVVQVTVTVLDGRGHYVKGLPKSAFHVSEDGRPQAISHFYSENVPLELARGAVESVRARLSAEQQRLRRDMA